MVVLDYLSANFDMIFELIGLLIMLKLSVHITERVKIWTRVVVALLFAESLAFHFEAWTQTFETLSPMRPILTASVYTLYPLILIALLRITTGDRMPRSTTIALLVPEVVSSVLYFTSQWTRLICWFDGGNHYHGGPLYFLPYAVFTFYSVVFIIENIRYFRGVSRISRFASIYIITVPVVGMAFCNLYADGKDFSPFFSAGILLYFILLYIHMATTDPLTSLLNRLSYDVEAKKNVTGVISIDMNGLKTVNDSEGHEAGDVALKTVAGVLKKCAGKRASVYRVGGDEFIILYANTEEKVILAAIAAMRDQLAKTDYTCSFGYAMVRPDGTLSDAISESDSNMYADKAEYYSDGGHDRRKAERPNA